MNDHSKTAMELFKQGYNCSQAVFAAFADELDMDQETAVKIASSFGGGMGSMREVCGAVTGIFMAAGIKYGYADPSDRAAKKEHYKLIQDLAAKFKNENGSIICRELLGIRPEGENLIPRERTVEYYKKRPCAEYVGYAALILEEMIMEKEGSNEQNSKYCRSSINIYDTEA